MPEGPGKYDTECEAARESTKAAAVLLIVLDGERGDGFSMTVDLSRLNLRPFQVAQLLRSVAADMEGS